MIKNGATKKVSVGLIFDLNMIQICFATCDKGLTLKLNISKLKETGTCCSTAVVLGLFHIKVLG